MQAKLPDVNAALVKHRDAIMNAYDRKDFKKAMISFDAIISLLPEDYRVEISTPKYEKLIQSKQVILCYECKAEHPREDIIAYQILLSNIEQIIAQEKIMRVWKCPKCQAIMPLHATRIKNIKYQQPTYFNVIPEPPSRAGLHDRTGFAEKFKVWYDIAFHEIENMISKYRTEYAAQQEAVMETLPND